MAVAISLISPLTGAGNGSGGAGLRADAKSPASVATRQEIPSRHASGEATPAHDIEMVVTQLNKHLQDVRSHLQFSIDETSKHIVIKVVDSETEEVIRQVPSEAVLALAANANGSGGVILDEQV
jgi:flagellar protein FlaG